MRIRRLALVACAMLAVAMLPRPLAAADLVIAGSTDRAAMQPLLDAFARLRPDLEVDYLERETVALYEGVRGGGLSPAPDLVISSAADLQVRLVNDGFTRRHVSQATERMPGWARWRSEAFGFTIEPLVFVVNPALLPPEHRPQSRNELARLVRAGGVDGPRVATYDVGQSGIGYLAASFDAVTMSDYWPFVETISGSGLLTACCTADVLDMVAEGRALVGYNVLGSYARARAKADDRVVVVMPEDFTVVIARVAVILRKAAHPDAAGAFLDFLLSPDGQRVLGDDALLPEGGTKMTGAVRGPIRTIALNAALLAVTDPMRRRQFIDLWRGVTTNVP
ncbi:ABC transporter substrate-binding protein [Methylobrevis pamukkalensis]|uniref:Bacterial extracellular solute-binding protein n=1 Tax=Methylobrevis pamukkalensis TaxID=1439726 RepID=A0A1E3GWT7_9HYPH|nr:ABC transporter substrate-binding protein [Methylobrevis pamukkalensis]ODN68510.1 Bacterial extracellular solute-binding protein [Methylobrevis pamukkalensis]